MKGLDLDVGVIASKRWQVVWAAGGDNAAKADRRAGHKSCAGTAACRWPLPAAAGSAPTPSPSGTT
jgi:hypothetical protein